MPSSTGNAKRERNRANRAADTIVQRDRERWIDQQVAEVKICFKNKNLRQFARACNRLAGRSHHPTRHGGRRGLAAQRPRRGDEGNDGGIWQAVWGRDQDQDETLNQLDNEVAAFELMHATQRWRRCTGPPPTWRRRMCASERCARLPLLAVISWTQRCCGAKLPPPGSTG
jgi:hypothetical protein